MLTFLIIFFGALVLLSIIRGAYLESDTNSGLEFLYFWPGLLVLITIISFILTINQSEEVVNSKTIIKPSMKIETIQNDSNIIKSDTTYIYKFKNN